MTPRAAAVVAALVATGCRDERPARLAPPPPAPAPPAPRAALRPPERLQRTPLRELLSPAARRALGDCMVTLLVPDDPSLVATADVRAGQDWAAISFPRGDHTVTLHAARPSPPRGPERRRGRAPPPPPPEPPREQRIRGARAEVSVAGGRAVATWEERGVAYTLDISCAVASDPRCTRERAVHEFASALVPLDAPR